MFELHARIVLLHSEAILKGTMCNSDIKCLKEVLQSKFKPELSPPPAPPPYTL